MLTPITPAQCSVTGYVACGRIEHARELLCDPSRRMHEVAYETAQPKIQHARQSWRRSAEFRICTASVALLPPATRFGKKCAAIRKNRRAKLSKRMDDFLRRALPAEN